MNAISPDRLEWLRQRQSGIGSSDAACLLGIGFQSARDIYYSKLEPVAAEKIEGDLLRGIDLEPLIARKYAEAMGVELRPAGFVRNAERPWQISNPDFIGMDDRYTEIKSVRGFDEDRGWGEQFTDQMPEKYLCQCQHQMGTRGNCDYMDLAAFDVYGWKLRVYRVRFDPEFFAWLTDIEERAWNAILARQPLAHEWEDQFREEYLRRVVCKGSAVELDPMFGPVLDELAALRRIKKEAEDAIEPVYESVKKAMGTHERARVGNWKIKRTVTTNAQVRYTITPLSEKE